MSYAGLLDHTVTRFRKTETFGDLRAVENTWTASGGLKAAIQVLDESRQDELGGTMTGGSYKGFMLPGADVIESDIIVVTGGPSSPGTLKVQSVYNVRGHHKQLQLTHTTEDLNPWSSGFDEGFGI